MYNKINVLSDSGLLTLSKNETNEKQNLPKEDKRSKNDSVND